MPMSVPGLPAGAPRSVRPEYVLITRKRYIMVFYRGRRAFRFKTKYWHFRRLKYYHKSSA